MKVKPFIAVLFRSATEPLLQVFERTLTQKIGLFDTVSPRFDVPGTAAEQAELGEPLARVFYSLTQPIPPAYLGLMKKKAVEVEGFFANEGRRPLLLDAGYVGREEVMLAGAGDTTEKMLLFYQGHWLAEPAAAGRGFDDRLTYDFFTKLRATLPHLTLV